jgi:hypothetical protein
VPAFDRVTLVSGLWSDRFALTSDQNTKGHFDNDRSGYRLSTSVGGAATGEGGDRIVCDDPHNVQEAESDSVRKATVDSWDVVMSTRVNDPKTNAMVVVMQRCGQRDLSGAFVGARRLGAPVPAGRVREVKLRALPSSSVVWVGALNWLYAVWLAVLMGRRI